MPLTFTLNKRQGIMTEPKQNKTLRDIIDKYSPIVKGSTSRLRKALARPVEWAQSALDTADNWAFPHGRNNAAGQNITAETPTAVAATFARMETKLRSFFNKAAAKDATPESREAFLSVAAEVKEDAKVLAPHASILRSEFDMVSEPYVFVVLEGAKGASFTTLDQGIAQVKAGQERKNPVTIRRKPAPTPETGGKAVGF